MIKMIKMIKTIEILNIPKNKYQNRTIYAPIGAYRKKLKELSPVLTELSHEADKCNSAYGFMPGRNNVMNALVHTHKKYILSLDIENFFDNIKSEMLKDILDEEQISLCFFENTAKQGLPTSPAISNLVFAKIDTLIVEFIKEKFAIYKYSYDMGMEVINGYECSYSRYADDLTFGFGNIKDLNIIKNSVEEILLKHGFNLNSKKTKLQNIDNGRVIITGVAIDSNGTIYPTRKMKRKLRSAYHHQEYAKAIIKGNKSISVDNILHAIRGLRESMRNKLPNEKWIKKLHKELNLDQQFTLFEFSKLIKKLRYHNYLKRLYSYNEEFIIKNYVNVNSIVNMNSKIISIKNQKQKEILLEFDSEKLTCQYLSEIINYKTKLYD